MFRAQRICNCGNDTVARRYAFKRRLQVHCCTRHHVNDYNGKRKWRKNHRSKGYTPNKSAMYAATKSYRSHLFVYYTTNGNGANLYNSCKSNTFISAEFQKSTSRRKARKMWIQVGSDAPFELVKQSSSKKSRAPKLKSKSMQVLYTPMDKTEDIPTKEVENNSIKLNWLNEKKVQEDHFHQSEKLRTTRTRAAGVDDIFGRYQTRCRGPWRWSLWIKIKEESSSDDEEPDNGENVDERMQFWKSLRKEQWDSEPPPFDDTSEIRSWRIEVASHLHQPLTLIQVE